MFWLYIAVACQGAVGTVNTIVGMALSIASYGAVDAILTRKAIRTGSTISSFSHVFAYLFMPADVLSYLLKALAWQGVFVTAWVAIALMAVYLDRRGANDVEIV